MKNHVFIFARGGSKGLPGKNIRLLDGKPLIQYAIDTALALPQAEQVFVSTDDDLIAQVAAQCGATVIERPAELAADNTPEWLAWQHACRWVIQRYGVFDGFISLPATSPLRSVNDVQRAVAQFYSSAADICISITPSNRNPYFNMVTFRQDGLVELVNPPDLALARRQDAPTVFDMTTVAYITSPEYIEHGAGVFAGTVTAVEIPKERAVDIDDIYDFTFAEALIRAGLNEQST